MKRLLMSLMVIGVVSATAIGASRAFFTDVERSEGNTFTAGELNLKIDSQCTYNGQLSDQCGSWELKDLVPTADKFFNFTDIKPGDWGENTISFHVVNNDAWACLNISNVSNLENTRTDLETAAGDTSDEVGELAQHVYFTAWNDLNGNNVWEAGENLLFTNKFGPASDVLDGRTYTLADSTTGTPIPGGPIDDPSKTTYIGLEWCFGTMEVNESTHVIACDGSNENNVTQTDSFSANVSFEVVQARNNPNFRCEMNENEHTLVLENKDPNYNRILSDSITGVLTWAGDGPTFDYSLVAHGLKPNTSYSLLYYADPWPGNNPGYFFGSATTDGAGDISMTDNSDIGMSLPKAPDTNAPGAKIWLIPTTAYDTGSRSVTVWPFANDWLFESNLIQYNHL